MLAAAPVEEAQTLRTFALALRMVLGEREVPENLTTYFNKVLSQARTLAGDPKSADRSTLPEAIQLALDMRDTSVLRSSLSELSELQALTPQLAEIILTGLERPLATDY